MAWVSFAGIVFSCYLQMASCCKHEGVIRSVKAFPVAATYASSHIWACFSLGFLWHDAREDRCTSSERGVRGRALSHEPTWVSLGVPRRAVDLNNNLNKVVALCSKGPSHSFLSSLAMEFVVSCKDELQGQRDKCFLVKPCHLPRTLQWPAAAVEAGVFAALLAASQCYPLVSKEVIAGSLHGYLVHHEQPHRSCAGWFSLLCISLRKSPLLWCSGDLNPHCRSSLWAIPGNCCLFSLLPCHPEQRR